MRLQNAQLNKNLKLIGFEEDGIQVKLSQYGLFVGDHLSVIRSAPLNGPLMIEVNGRTIALSRRVAKKILVEEVP